MRKDSLGLFWQDEPPKPKQKVDKPKRTPPVPTWLAPDYLPGLEQARNTPIHMMTDQEMMAAAYNRERLVFDVESYINYFLVAFTSLQTGKAICFEMESGGRLDTPRLQWVLQSFTIVGFNSYSYDMVILALAVAGKSTEQMKHATNLIIQQGYRPRDVLKEFHVKALQKVDHIDIIEVAPLHGSLKIYGGRLHVPTMQDLPFHPEATLSPDQILITRWYCVNDLVQTAMLHNSLTEQLNLRETMSHEYGIDLRSRSDAQIAEAVISDEVSKLNGYRPQRPTIEPGTVYRYNVPNFLRYETPLMNWVLGTVANTRFIVGEDGNVGMPEELKELRLNIANGVYRMGIGGLHSSEKKEAHVADEHTLLIDRDVTSYYPEIILGQGLYPKHLGVNFLRVYRQIVERRVAAKRAKNKVVSESLKITINGSYGKLGSKYSILYAPDLLIQVTLTGQLALLMLIERLELRGINVVSANTDGLVIKCPKARLDEMNGVVASWERDTGFETEEALYRALYSRDVNNYIAVKEDGTVKAKGAYARPGLQKNPTNEICIEAVEMLLTKNVPVHETIRNCTDIRKFVSVRSVKGGAVKMWDRLLPPHEDKKDLLLQTGFEPVEGGYWRHPSWTSTLDVASLESAYEHAVRMWPEGKHEYLGKSIRWYYAKGETGEIVYATNGNKVPRSDGACPLMVLPDTFPSNVDYEWYETETYMILKQIGYYGD